MLRREGLAGRELTERQDAETARGIVGIPAGRGDERVQQVRVGGRRERRDGEGARLTHHGGLAEARQRRRHGRHQERRVTRAGQRGGHLRKDSVRALARAQLLHEVRAHATTRRAVDIARDRAECQHGAGLQVGARVFVGQHAENRIDSGLLPRLAERDHGKRAHTLADRAALAHGAAAFDRVVGKGLEGGQRIRMLHDAESQHHDVTPCVVLVGNELLHGSDDLRRMLRPGGARPCHEGGRTHAPVVARCETLQQGQHGGVELVLARATATLGGRRARQHDACVVARAQVEEGVPVQAPPRLPVEARGAAPTRGASVLTERRRGTRGRRRSRGKVHGIRCVRFTRVRVAAHEAIPRGRRDAGGRLFARQESRVDPARPLDVGRFFDRQAVAIEPVVQRGVALQLGHERDVVVCREALDQGAFTRDVDEVGKCAACAGRVDEVGDRLPRVVLVLREASAVTVADELVDHREPRGLLRVREVRHVTRGELGGAAMRVRGLPGVLRRRRGAALLAEQGGAGKQHEGDDQGVAHGVSPGPRSLKQARGHGGSCGRDVRNALFLGVRDARSASGAEHVRYVVVTGGALSDRRP